MKGGKTCKYECCFRWEEDMNYWGGAQPNPDRDSVTCACYETQTCADPTKRCNCDSNDRDVWRADEGFLTFKDDLPVTKFQAGDTGNREIATTTNIEKSFRFH